MEYILEQAYCPLWKGAVMKTTFHRLHFFCMKLTEKHENNFDGRHPLPAVLQFLATLMTATKCGHLHAESSFLFFNKNPTLTAYFKVYFWLTFLIFRPSRLGSINYFFLWSFTKRLLTISRKIFLNLTKVSTMINQFLGVWICEKMSFAKSVISHTPLENLKLGYFLIASSCKDDGFSEALNFLKVILILS